MDNRKIWEAHPELFHYTSRAGLKGILESQCLWATHYRHLNDSSELQLMRAELADRIYPIIKEKVLERHNEANLSVKRKMKQAGGVIRISRDEATRLADTFYRTAFIRTDTRPPITEPYITSFCAHTDDEKYVHDNGLLSQWRGYAKGGFAIVFDTKKLCDLYVAEFKHYYSANCSLGDVVYQDDEKAFEDNFSEPLERIRNELKAFADTGNMEPRKIFGDILSMFTRLKHKGLREEREVRAVAYPMTKELEDAYKRLDSNYKPSGKPLKEIMRRPDGAPYIETLNLDGKSRLPIKRIIVGPQKDQEKVKREIEAILADPKIQVHCSETPLVWPDD